MTRPLGDKIGSAPTDSGGRLELSRSKWLAEGKQEELSGCRLWLDSIRLETIRALVVTFRAGQIGWQAR